MLRGGAAQKAKGRIRTDNFRFTKPAFYQLNYLGTEGEGFEPPRIGPKPIMLPLHYPSI